MTNQSSTNYERAFADHPAVYSAWGELIGSIRGQMDVRRYVLATLAAARAIGSSYCSLAHGQWLEADFGESVVAIATDRRHAGLSDVDVAIMDFAEQVATNAPSVTRADRQRLADLGLSETEIDQVVFAAAARCFFAKSLDGLLAQPDSSYLALSEEMRAVLVVGTPIEQVRG